MASITNVLVHEENPDGSMSDRKAGGKYNHDNGYNVIATIRGESKQGNQEGYMVDIHMYQVGVTGHSDDENKNPLQSKSFMAVGIKSDKSRSAPWVSKSQVDKMREAAGPDGVVPNAKMVDMRNGNFLKNSDGNFRRAEVIVFNAERVTYPDSRSQTKGIIPDSKGEFRPARGPKPDEDVLKANYDAVKENTALIEAGRQTAFTPDWQAARDAARDSALRQAVQQEPVQQNNAPSDDSIAFD